MLIVLALLLWWSLRKAPLRDIWSAIQQVQLWQIAVLLILNGIFYIVARLDCRTIVRADNPQVPDFQHLCAWLLADE